jgi:hypothetical protein
MHVESFLVFQTSPKVGEDDADKKKLEGHDKLEF